MADIGTVGTLSPQAVHVVYGLYVFTVPISAVWHKASMSTGIFVTDN